MLKALLIVAIVIQGVILYGFIGFLVFLVSEKVDGIDWREDWEHDQEHVIPIILVWPLLIVVGIIALPFLAVWKVIDGIAKKGE